MDVWLLTADGIEQQPVDDLPSLLERPDGFVWVDIPHPDDEAVQVLSKVFKFHYQAVHDCAERNMVPKVHAYPDHVFVVLHTPEMGLRGHVHYVELDQFIAQRYLVTVHGPLNPVVQKAIAMRETNAVRRRLQEGRLHPADGFELSYAIVSALCRHQEGFVETQTRAVWDLERQVTSGHLGNPEKFLDEMFRTRHGLVVVRTMAGLSREIYGRLAAIQRTCVPVDARPLLDDVVDQFSRVYAIADGQKEYLQGVIDFYRTRSDTKMTVAAERLAVIAVITLPITALSSIYGMNVIVNQHTHVPQLIGILIVMAVMSGLLLTWAKRQGWW